MAVGSVNAGTRCFFLSICTHVTVVIIIEFLPALGKRPPNDLPQCVVVTPSIL